MDLEYETQIEREKQQKRDKKNISGHVTKLNKTSMNQLKFRDFASLRTGGQDSWSRANEVSMDAYLEADGTKNTINAANLDEKLRLSAKRWAARGLEATRAIRKVKTDAEIAGNAHPSVMQQASDNRREKRRAKREAEDDEFMFSGEWG